MRPGPSVLVVCAVVATLTITWPLARGAEAGGLRTLAIAGSGSALALTRHLATAFTLVRRDIALEISSGIGSTGGIMAVADGAIDLGLSSRPLRDSEQAAGLVEVPFAISPLVVGAHPTVADDAVTSAALVEIYRGTRRHWSDGEEIVVLNREPGDANVAVLSRHVPGFAEAFAEASRARRWAVLYTHQDMSRAIARTPYAMGTIDGCSLAVERSPIKALQLDGVAPTAENVRAGRYRVVRPLTLVYRAGRLPAQARAYLDFVRSGQGREAIRAAGCVPA
jgi:phosphate transport system substrate-binding protein